MSPYAPDGAAFTSSASYQTGLACAMVSVCRDGLAKAVRAAVAQWPKAHPDWRVQDTHRGLADGLAFIHGAEMEALEHLDSLTQ